MPNAEPIKETSLARAGRLAILGSRLAVIGLIVWLGWEAVLTFRRLLEPTPAPVPSANREPPLADDLAELLLQPGSWTLPGETWSMRSVAMSREEALSRLASPLPAEIPEEAVAEWERLALGFRAVARSERLPGGEDTLLRIDLPEFKLRLRTRRVEGVERVLSARCVLSADQEHWALLEMRPDAWTKPQDLLLPIPRSEGIRVVAIRDPEETGGQAWLVSSPEDLAGLARLWERDGWKVAVVAGEGYPGRLTAERAGRVVQAWGLPRAEGSDRGLLLLAETGKAR